MAIIWMSLYFFFSLDFNFTGKEVNGRDDRKKSSVTGKTALKGAP